MSATQLIVDNYFNLRANGAEFFETLLSTSYDFLGMYAIRKELLNPKTETAPSESSASPQSSPAAAPRHTIYVGNPEELTKDTRKIMESDKYKNAKDFCLHNFKIALFNIITVLIITKVFFMVIGVSSITLPALAGLAVQAIVRDLLDKSIENSNAKVGIIGRTIGLIDKKFISGDDWFGGEKVGGFFRTWAVYPNLRAAFLWH